MWRSPGQANAKAKTGDKIHNHGKPQRAQATDRCKEQFGNSTGVRCMA